MPTETPLKCTHTHTHTHKYLYAQIPKKRRKPTQILTVTSVSTPKCCSVISLLALLNRNFSSMTPCVSECLCQSFLSFFFFFGKCMHCRFLAYLAGLLCVFKLMANICETYSNENFGCKTHQ